MSEPRRAEIERQVTRIVAEVLNRPTDLDPKARLVEELGAESVDLLSLVFDLEEAFGGQIPEEDVAQLTTIAEIADYIHASEQRAAN